MCPVPAPHPSPPSCVLWTPVAPLSGSWCQRVCTGGHVMPSAASCHSGSTSPPSLCSCGRGWTNTADTSTDWNQNSCPYGNESVTGNMWSKIFSQIQCWHSSTVNSQCRQTLSGFWIPEFDWLLAVFAARDNQTFSGMPVDTLHISTVTYTHTLLWSSSLTFFSCFINLCWWFVLKYYFAWQWRVCVHIVITLIL